MYDVIVVGGGPAGLTAALYSLRAGKSVLIIEKENFGGQMTFSPKIENYPGFESISGNELASHMLDQVIAQGAELAYEEVTDIDAGGDIKTVTTDYDSYESLAVIIAAGVKHRLLGIQGEDDFIGNGISFCAVCDGAFYQDKHVLVIGGGNSALQEALLLSETSSKVTVVQNLDYLTGEKKLVDLIEEKNNIEVIYGHTVEAYIGEDTLAGVKIKDSKTGEIKELTADGVFLAIGLAPVNAAFKSAAALDERGYVVADSDCRASEDGIFVAGDCRAKKVRQIATAVSDGATAALEACAWVDAKKKG